MAQGLAKLMDMVAGAQSKTVKSDKKTTKSNGQEILAASLLTTAKAGELTTKKDIKSDAFKALLGKKLENPTPNIVNKHPLGQISEKTALKEAVNHLEPEQQNLILKNLTNPINKQNLVHITDAASINNAVKANEVKKEGVKTESKSDNKQDNSTDKLHKTISKSFDNLTEIIQKAESQNKQKNPTPDQLQGKGQEIEQLANTVNKTAFDEAKFANEGVPVGKMKMVSHTTFETASANNIAQSIGSSNIANAESIEKIAAGQFLNAFSENSSAGIAGTTINRGASVSFNQSNFEQFSSVSEQITESVRTNLSADNNKITVNLNPPELGKLIITFNNENGILSGKIQAERTATGADIERNMPQIIKNLQDAGVNISKVEITVPDGNPNRDLGFESGYNQRKHNQEYSQPNNGNRASETNEPQIQPQQQSYLSEETVNLYL